MVDTPRIKRGPGLFTRSVCKQDSKDIIMAITTCSSPAIQ